MLSCSSENGPRSLPVASARHRPPERVAAANRPHRCWQHRAGRSCWNTSGSARRCRGGSSPPYTARRWSTTPSWSNNSPHRKAITTLTPAACWITGWRSSPMRSSCGSPICCPLAAVPKTRRRSLKPGLPQSLMPRCCTTSARSPSICTSNCPTARCGTLARPAAPAIPLRYRDDREYRLHSAATGLLYRQLLDRDALDWLSGYPDLWGPLLYVLAGQYERAGVLGELVVQADRASVAQELGGDPARAMAAHKHALQRKLLDGLRYLLKEQLKLNQPEASDGWITEDALWLVSKTVSDKLRAHLLSLGVDGIPRATPPSSTCCRITACCNRRRTARRSGARP